MKDQKAIDGQGVFYRKDDTNRISFLWEQGTFRGGVVMDVI
ncbi:hypothetical protein AB4Z29_25095 [Paenibacillus sp. 2TAB23]